MLYTLELMAFSSEIYGTFFRGDSICDISMCRRRGASVEVIDFSEIIAVRERVGFEC